MDRPLTCKKKSLTVEVAGGLGNQLFCYFAGKYFSIKSNKNLKVDLLYAAKSHSRYFDITSFNLGETYLNQISEKSKEKKKLGWRVSDSLAYRCFLFRTFRERVLGIYVEQPRAEFAPELYKQIATKRRIKGFFTTSRYLELLQAAGYFKSLELSNPSPWFMEMSKVFSEMRPISVHVRRGDFIAERETYGVLSEAYYEAAISLARKNFPNSPIYIFTNDINEVKQWTVFKRFEVEFIERSTNGIVDEKDDPAEHLKLMSLSEVNIVSNSSFSLFAGLLNPEAKMVIRPNPVAKAKEYRLGNFYPENWLTIAASWE